MRMVVGCHNRQSNYSKIGFITFPERRSIVEGRFPLFHVRIVMVPLGNQAMETVFILNFLLMARNQMCAPTQLRAINSGLQF